MNYSKSSSLNTEETITNKRKSIRPAILKLKKATNFIMSEVSELKAGESFGDYALLDDGPRTATISTKTPVHFGVLTREEFSKILCKIYSFIIYRVIYIYIYRPHINKILLFQLGSNKRRLN